MMLTKYVCCENCEYQDYCEKFDPFFGCNSGKIKVLNEQPLLTEQENSEILIGDKAMNTINKKDSEVYY